MCPLATSVFMAYAAVVDIKQCTATTRKAESCKASSAIERRAQV